MNAQALNILKTAALYTGIYAVYVTIVWIAMVTIQVFWKPILVMFVIFVSLLTLDRVVFKQSPNFYPDYDTCMAWVKSKF